MSAPQPAQSNSIAWLYWLAGLAVLLAAGAVLLLRRRGNQPPASPAAASEPRPAASPPPAPTPSAVLPPEAPALHVAFLPSRAGLNLLTALVEGEVMLSNRSDGPLDGIRVAAHLLSAHTGQADDVAAVTGAPIVRPAVPVFALQPGESRSIRVVAPLARNAVVPMSAGDRPIFVPLVVVVADHAAGRTVQGFAVGIERVDSAKLAPIWLDVPPRMYDTVAARPQALPSQGKSP